MAVDTESSVVTPLIDQPAAESPYQVDDATSAPAGVDEDVTSGDESTEPSLEDLGPEELRELLAKERADKEALRKAKVSGKEGEINRYKRQAQEAEARYKELADQVKELKQTQDQQAQRQVQAQLTGAIQSQLDQYRKQLEDAGWDEPTIKDRVSERHHLLKAEARAQESDWKATRAEWKEQRDASLDAALVQAATDFKDEWGIDLALNRNEVLSQLKLDIMATYPNQQPGLRAADEFNKVLGDYIKQQRKAAISAVKGQAAKSVTQPPQREAHADRMVEAGNGGMGWRDAIDLRKRGEITTSEFIRRMQSAPYEERAKFNIL